MVTEQDVFDALRYRIRVDHHGTRKYFNKAGQLHREGGAAVEQANAGIKMEYCIVPTDPPLNGVMVASCGTKMAYRIARTALQLNGVMAVWNGGSMAWK